MSNLLYYKIKMMSHAAFMILINNNY